MKKFVWVLEIDNDYIDLNGGDMENLWLFLTEKEARAAIPKLLSWCKTDPKENSDYYIYRKEINAV